MTIIQQLQGLGVELVACLGLLHKLMEMEMDEAAILDDSYCKPTVGVVIGKNKKDLYALAWALDRLVPHEDCIVVIYLRDPITAVPTPMGNYIPIKNVRKDVADAYRKHIASVTKELLFPVEKLCQSRKVRPKIKILEEPNNAEAIVNEIIGSALTKLFMHSSKNPSTRMIAHPNLEETVAKNIPDLCRLYVMSKGKISLKRSPSNVNEGSFNNSLSRISLFETSTSDSVHSGLPDEETPEDNIVCYSELKKQDDKTSLTSTSKDHSPLFLEDMKRELQKLKDELAFSRQRYNAIYEEAVTAKRKVQELQIEREEEAKKLEAAKAREELALAMAAEEKTRREEALWEAEALKDIVRIQHEELTKHSEIVPSEQVDRYRKYSIEEIDKATDYLSESFKIGEGGYGSVYKGTIHHTEVAIKVLHPEAAKGWTQFKQEVDILSGIRHPNMVLLLGACQETGCLVYEYMSNGSLEDRLFRRGATPPLPWQLRFAIAAEVATALLFLHSFRPRPVVHRDLKPANVLLDRHFRSKISDVGHARAFRLRADAESSSCYANSKSTVAGTPGYIDPEYQRSGKLRTKSDTYALGILLLQLLTAKCPSGLVQAVEKAIRKGTTAFANVLDSSIKDWPLPQSMELAKLALRCAELSHKDRPDLQSQVLPLLQTLNHFAQQQQEFHFQSHTHSLRQAQAQNTNPRSFNNAAASSRFPFALKFLPRASAQ